MKFLKNRERLIKFTHILIIYFILNLFTCSNIDGLNRKQEVQNNRDTLFLIIATSRAMGNCLRKDLSTNKAYCDRRSSGLCNANDLILTSAEKIFNLNEGKDLVNKISGCSYSFITSGISSESIASYSDEDTIKANNAYSIIDSCDTTGITSSATLLGEAELLFINSSKGRIGVAADTLYNTPDAVLSISLGSLSAAQQAKSDALHCLDVGFLQSEKDLFTGLRNGTKTKALTCDLNGGANPCPF